MSSFKEINLVISKRKLVTLSTYSHVVSKLISEYTVHYYSISNEFNRKCEHIYLIFKILR
jgi:hypothetical protein